MDEILPLPTICVDLDSLYDGSYDKNSIANNGATREAGEELSLVVRLDKEICPVISGDSSSGTLPRPLDLQQVDFLGSVDVVKKLFSMPYTDQRPLFTLHRMGNTLLLDNVTCHATNPYDINFSAESKSHRDQGDNSNERSIPPASASTGGKNGSLQYADSSFKTLDHLIASANVESLLGKVTPLYLSAPLKQQLGLLTNEENDKVQAVDSGKKEMQNDSILCDGEKSCPPLSAEETITSEGLGISPRNCTFTTEKLKATLGSIEGDNSYLHTKIPGFEEYRREVSIASGSPFLPPPNYFMPSVPPPAR